MGPLMEPITHLLTGACIGRSGLNRRTAYATLAAVLAAEAPDIDVVWAVRGPVESFAHHRGITHTFVAAPVIALAVTGCVWLIHRYIPQRKSMAIDAQPIHWLWIFFSALISVLSHLLLDWTNNYGLRPFFPFNAHWYSGDLVFIAEPVLWALLLAAVVLPALLGLADREIGARRMRFRGRGLAIAALTGMVLLWCWRWAEHAQAHTLVENAHVTPTPERRIALMPYPGNPWRWHALIETGTTWQTAEVDTRSGLVESDARINSLFKPAPTPASEAARRTRLGQVYLDWAQWPVVLDLGPQAIPGTSAPQLSAGRQWSAVEFTDLRFAYPYLIPRMATSTNQSLEDTLARSALSGWVYIVDGREDAGQFLNGREQK